MEVSYESNERSGHRHPPASTASLHEQFRSPNQVYLQISQGKEVQGKHHSQKVQSNSPIDATLYRRSKEQIQPGQIHCFYNSDGSHVQSCSGIRDRNDDDSRSSCRRLCGVGQNWSNSKVPDLSNHGGTVEKQEMKLATDQLATDLKTTPADSFTSSHKPYPEDCPIPAHRRARLVVNHEYHLVGSNRSGIGGGSRIC
jgi:hypothetical protein